MPYKNERTFKMTTKKSVSPKPSKAKSKKSVSQKSINTKNKKNAKDVFELKEETFYYDIEKLKQFLVFNIFLVFISLKLIYCQHLGIINLKIGVTVVIILSILATLGTLLVYIYPQRLALVTDKGLIIDHNELLKWEDISVAKEVVSYYLLYPQYAIALIVKEGVTHKLTFMQKMCKNNIFTPFSIPLYAMKKEDREKINLIIKQKVKYESKK